MNLPPLPEPYTEQVIEYRGIAVNKTETFPLFTADQTRAYGQACAEAASNDFHMAYRMKCDEETKALTVANTKLVGAIDMIRETLKGGNVEDLLLIINRALDEYHATQKPSEAQQFGGDLWSGMYGN